MSLRILYVTATQDEAGALKNLPGIKTYPEGFLFNGHDIRLLITGVGSMSASWAMTKWLSVNPKPDLAINAGIAGSFREDIINGDVVIPVSDCFADAGIESEDGFITLAEAGLEDGDKFPFRGGRIVADNKYSRMAAQLLKPVKAVTVNTATGSAATSARLAARFDPDIETMEGAAFFYICSREKIPFLSLRAISNRVGPRDKSKWNILLALENLSEKLNSFLLMLYE